MQYQIWLLQGISGEEKKTRKQKNSEEKEKKGVKGQGDRWQSSANEGQGGKTNDKKSRRLHKLQR